MFQIVNRPRLGRNGQEDNFEVVFKSSEKNGQHCITTRKVKAEAEDCMKQCEASKLTDVAELKAMIQKSSKRLKVETLPAVVLDGICNVIHSQDF